MNTIQFLYSISAFVLFGYMTISCLKFGFPKSLSDTYYLWSNSDLKKERIFSIALTITVMLLLFPFVETSPTILTRFIAFICCCGLGFVGSAPLFKDYDATMHYASAGVAAFMAIIWSILSVECGWWIVIICGLFSAVMCAAQWKNKVWWLEIGAFLIAYISIAYNLFSEKYNTF